MSTRTDLSSAIAQARTSGDYAEVARLEAFAKAPGTFTEDQIGQQVSEITIGDDFPRQNESFETAAWYRQHKVTPGTYPVKLGRYAHGGFTLTARVPTIIVDAYLGTLWGGVAVGTDKSGPREVGKADERTLSLGFAYKLDELRLPSKAEAVA